jgi:hypothetical protein
MGFFGADWEVLKPAQEDGDWEPLAKHIESGGEITDAIRKFIAGILRGEISRKRQRPRKESVRDLGEWIAYFVVERERDGMRTGRAIEMAAKKFRVTPRTVQRKLAAYRSQAEWEIGWQRP